MSYVSRIGVVIETAPREFSTAIEYNLHARICYRLEAYASQYDREQSLSNEKYTILPNCCRMDGLCCRVESPKIQHVPKYYL